jgi:taurine dioxygenase
MGDDPEIVMVRREPGDTGYVGEDWHADTTMWPEPPMGAILYGIDVPPYGGDTMFANQYMAYEALSDGLKATLDGLIGVSSSTKAEVSKTREDRLKAAGKETKPLTAEHPIVRTHPETGRKALYTSSAHTSHIKGWTERESLALLEFLWEHQVRPEFTCRFRWETGSLAFWDNRCAMHNAINDYHGHRRVMHRITLAGDKPR